MSYLFISIFVLIISFFLFKKSSGTMSLTQLNIISFNFYYQLIIQSFVGVNIVILGLDNHYLLSRITDLSIKQSAYFSVVFVLLAMPLSMLFISFIFRFDAHKEWLSYTSKEIKSILSKDDKAVFLTLILFSFISFLSIAYTFISIGTIPILQMLLDSNAEEAARLRIVASREFGGIVYFRNVFGLTMTPILSYIAYSYTIKSKYIGWKVIFGVLVTLSVLILTYSGSKAPVLLYILSFIFLQVLIKGKINIRKMFSLILITVIVLIGFYNIISDFQTSFFDINSGPLGRILLGQITSLYFHYLYFPEIIPYLEMNGLPSIFSKLYDIESIRSSRLIMEAVNPRGVELGISGVMNTLFIAEIYAAFGWLGVTFGTFFVGFYIQFIYIFMLRFPKNPILLSLFTYLTFHIPLTGGFFDFIYNPGLLIILFLLFTFYLVANILQRLLIKKVKEKGTYIV